MADITLQAEIRTETGSGAVGRLRAAGQLPAVAYGKGRETLNLVLNHHDVSKALHDPASREGEMTLSIGGTGHRVTLHHIQRDPVRRTAAHLDFVFVS